MKKISILIPTYNEGENIVQIYNELMLLLQTQLNQYDYEILIIDNYSKDNTRDLVSKICDINRKVKAIFNVKNFGASRSVFHGLRETQGDCAILLCADFQDPLNVIPQFICEWEKGYKIVCGIKSTSKENKFMYFVRSMYYKAIKRMSDIEQIEHFTGFGLYDKSFIEILRELDDTTPFLRGIVAELGFNRKDIPYTQEKRRAGKTSTNFLYLYDLAMLSFTSYTKIGLRLATFFGMFISIGSLIFGLVYLFLKLLYWNTFPMGTAPILIGVFFLGSIQLFFIGLVGEYIMSINNRIMKRPLVIEEKRINFEDTSKATHLK